MFIYYSGHGAPDPASKGAYFVPVDADPNALALNGYSYNTFFKNLSQLQAKSITLVLDTCFSGASPKGELLQNRSSLYLDVSQPQVQDNRMMILTASTNEQMATWYPDKKHGLFTYYFLKALQGKPDEEGEKADKDNNNELTMEEIYQYVNGKVKYMAGRLHNAEQTPQLQGTQTHQVLVRY